MVCFRNPNVETRKKLEIEYQNHTQERIVSDFGFALAPPASRAPVAETLGWRSTTPPHNIMAYRPSPESIRQMF
jgi:hypothetical protein